MRREGIVYKGVGGLYRVRSGAEFFHCKARGRLKKEGDVLMVGDRVTLAQEPSGEYVIEEIGERRNELLRPPVANVDQAVIVFAVSSPSPSFYLLDKMILSSEYSGVRPVLLFNKADLGEIDLSRYDRSGYEILVVSAERRSNIDRLVEILRDRVTVLTGPSGVGKSSLLNLLQDEYQAETGAVSKAANRGRHTTRHSELFELACGGIVIDSPGYASIHLDFIGSENLAGYFPEFHPYAGSCRFSDCRHISEPGCRVREAAGADFPRERYESYCRIYAQIIQQTQTERRTP